MSLSNQKRPWIILGLMVSLAIFSYNVTLPDLYKGRVCCDSVDYIGMADAMSVDQIFGANDVHHVSNQRTIGYPIFLYLHKQFLNLWGLEQAVDWVNLGIVSSWILYLTIMFLFIQALRKKGVILHPVIYFLLFAHPALVSASALPLSDILATSILCLGFIAMLRSAELDLKSSVRWLFGAGMCFGYAALCRMQYLTGIILFSALWMVISLVANAKRNFRELSLKGIFLALGIFVINLPGIVHYSKLFQQLAVIDPTSTRETMIFSLNTGFKSPRLYGYFNPRPSIRAVEDPWLIEHFEECLIKSDEQGSVLGKALLCYIKKPFASIVFFVKKVTGLFDNYILNAYAVEITEGSTVLFYRIFGVLGFVGFFLSLTYVPRVGLSKKFSSEVLSVLLFPLVFLAFQSLFHVEGRYGFPALPGSVVCLVLSLQEIKEINGPKKAILLAFCLVCACYFVWQTAVWDALDPMKYY